MDWIRAISELTGRCKNSRKVGNHTYLKRVYLNHDKDNSNDAVAVHFHRTDVLTFFPDGSININTGGWNTVTTKDRINTFFAGRIWSEHGHAFVSYDGQTVAMVGGTSARVENGVLIGADAELERKEIREEINEANRPRNRARYWTNKAREGKPYKGTVESIFAEENQTVRVAKIRCYGIERFFLDAKAEIVDSRAGYELLALPLTGNRHGEFVRGWDVQKMYAVKMVCSTTGAVYINPVPQQCTDVPSALDWIFNTTDYLGTVTQQT